MKTSTCKYCGKTYNYIGNRFGIYCSFNCYNKDRNVDITKTCPVCGKIFTHCKSQETKCCSKECSNKAQLKGIYKICLVCKKSFYVSRANLKRYTTCSLACAKKFPSAWRRYPAHLTNCETCGKEFRHTPSTNPKYCCFACYRRGVAKRDGETSIEKKVRLFLKTFNIPYEQEYKIARYSIDFYIPLLNLAIECDGKYWHKDKTRDKAKNQYLKRHGIKLLRLSEDEINSNDANKKIELQIFNQNLKFI